jgi:4'-phosphopantetheinyl transferase EntD
LAELGIASRPLVPRSDRSPTWPAGVVGSITHTKDYCAVVVARGSALRSVGVDAEADRTLELGLITLICTAEERQRMARRPHGDRDAIVYFAGKEAFYKCQYPLTRTFLDFQDVDLELDHAAGTLRVRAVRGLAQSCDWLAQLRGRFLRRDQLVLCGFELS